MKRQPTELEQRRFDVVIIGGGITGAALAFDAADRGLVTALIDKGDFGAATSAASSKLLHGGLRYLQNLAFGKVRESALERMYFQNLVPHQTRYVPFVVPTYRGLSRGRALLSAGMLAYETLCLGQNRHVRDRGKRVPFGRSLTAAEVRNVIPGVRASGLTGGRLFYESHMHSSERVTLAFIDGAARKGACVANYVVSDRFLLEQGRVVGVQATDRLSGHRLTVRGRLILNAAGPWIRQLNEQLGGRTLSGIVTGFSKGAHIVTRPLTAGHAVALPTQRRNQAVIHRGGRHVFIIPWRGKSLIGTTYGPYEGDLDAVGATAADVAELIDDVNAALGPQTLSPDDVLYSYAGLYPLVQADIDPEVYQGTGDYQVVDHEAVDGVPGLLSVFGAKYTTARLLAERTLDLVSRKLGDDLSPCRTRKLALPAGEIVDLDRFRAERYERYRDLLSAQQVNHLITAYGAAADSVVGLAQEVPELIEPLASDRDTLALEAIWATRHEMAVHLEDFVFRRTGLGTLGDPGTEALRRAAEIMGGELGWDTERRNEEIERVAARFAA